MELKNTKGDSDMLDSQYMSELVDENGESLNTTPVKIEKPSKRAIQQIQFSLSN
jgi:hypothetical protein